MLGRNDAGTQGILLEARWDGFSASLPKFGACLCSEAGCTGVALRGATVDNPLITVLLSGDMQATQTLVLQRPAVSLNGLLPGSLLLLLVSSQCGCGMRN